MPKIPKLGQKVRFVPSCFEGQKLTGPGGKLLDRTLTGRVVYIHPKNRFYTVAAKCGDGVLRESFLIR